MGKQSSGGTQTTTMEPPAYIKPYLEQAARGAMGLYAGPGQAIPTAQSSAPASGFNAAASRMMGRPVGGSAGAAPSPSIDPFSAWTPEYYPGSQVTPFSGATDAALTGITQRAMGGSPLIDSAQQFVQSGLQAPIQSNFAGTNPYSAPVGVGQVSGGAGENPYANTANPFGGASNPFLDATFDKAFGKSMQSVESQFARGGRNIGSSMPVASDIASNLASQIYAPAYENERNRMANYAGQQLGIGAQGFESGQGRALQAGLANQSAGMQAALAGQQIGAQGYEAGQDRALQDIMGQRQLQQGLLGYASPLAAQDYMDLAQLQGAGQAYDTQNQAMLNDDINRWNYNQNRPGMALDSLLQRLSGMPGSTQTTQLPTQYRNAGAGAMGGAMAGYSMFGPWGALGGGILGAM